MARNFSDESKMMRRDGEGFVDFLIRTSPQPNPVGEARMYLINETADGGDLVPLSAYLWFRARRSIQSLRDRVLSGR